MVIAAKGQSSAEDPLSECRGTETEDPLYGCQWHLKNTGQLSFYGKAITAGEDINTEGVWNDDVYGAGINVAVVADGMQTGHEDLADNVNTSLNHDYSGSGNVYDPSKARGTRISGVIAAVGDNSLGVRGAAPKAGIYGYNLAGNFSNANAKDAMVRNKEITAVSVNGWGPEDGYLFQGASAAWEEGVEEGIREGFYGKGVFYVRGAGDGYENNDQANFSEYSNYYGVTAVCSTDGSGRKSSFSEEGVNLWVCAPGEHITTTDNNDGYVFDASGTAYSASQVGGVAALLREINGELSWRDIKLILAGSARQNDVSDISWETGAVKYGSDVERYNYNPKYGFGVVDAEAAAELAKSWKGVGEMRTVTAFSDNEITIPDGEGEADGVLVSRLIIPDLEKTTFTEFTEVELVLSCDCLQDLNIQITSPSGTVSELVREVVSGPSDEEKNCVSYLRRTHRFGSAKHLGEDPSGEWTLNIADTGSGDEEDEKNTVTLHSWSIKVYGHKKGDTVQDFTKEITPKVPPSASWGQLPDRVYTVGEAITPLTLPGVIAGTPPITYSFDSLPAGLSFDPDTRVLTGTPTTVKVRSPYRYAASNSEGEIFTFVYITVKDLPPTFNETIGDKEYIVGQQVTLTLPEATRGNGELTYSLAPAPPAGLSFDADTRVLSGRPSLAKSATFYRYTVTDEDNVTAELTFNITIHNDSSPTFGSETIDAQEYIAGSPITPVTLPVATRGNAPLTYSITPTLPDGLDFDDNTRVLSGTPTTAMSQTTYRYTVTDTDGDTARINFRITVTDDTLTFGSEIISNQNYVKDHTITPVTLPEATGGSGNLTYSLTPSSLPTGLSFNNNTRVISGTPTQLIFNRRYTYTVTDGDGNTAMLFFLMSVENDTNPSFLDTITDKEYFTGTAVTETLPEAQNPNPPSTYSLVPDLPPGLDFDPATRVISGTPTTATPETAYTYTVTDTDGDTRSLMFRITVRTDGAPTFGNETIRAQSYVIRSPIRPLTLPVATGGDPPLRYSLTPSLPPGLSFNRNTRRISGTPSTVTSRRTYTYTVTDNNGETAELRFTIRVTNPQSPTPPGGPRTSGTDSGGGGGGCAVSDQSSFVPGLLGAVACLILIPVSVVIRRKRRSQIKM